MNTVVSIITPLYESENFICETIRSVLDQVYSDWELIIVDDLSTDNSVTLVKEFQKSDSRIKLLKNEFKSGPAFSRNRAIQIAKGRYIAFLDSDDIWYPTKLQEQLDFMRRNDYSFTFTGYERITEEGLPAGYINIPDKVCYKDLLKTCSVGCLTAMYDSYMLGKLYMPIIEKRQDFALWLSILREIPIGYGLNKPLAKYRLRGNSVSSNKWRASLYQWKVYRQIEKISFLKSIYYFSFYTSHGILKTYFKNSLKVLLFLSLSLFHI